MTSDPVTRSRRPAMEPPLTRLGEFGDPEVERAFRRERFRKELAGPLRWSAWSATSIYAVFGAIDYVVVPDVVDVAWTIRYGAIVPIALALAVLSTTRAAERCLWLIGFLHCLIGPALFLTVGALAADPGGLLYTTWALLFPLLVPQLTRMSVSWSVGVACIVAAYFFGVEAWLGDRSLTVELFIAMFLVVGCGYGAWVTYTGEVAGRRSYWHEQVIAWQMDQLGIEREKSERLLLNVLPAPIADRLRGREETIADTFEEVGVLFADIVGFTEYSAKVSASQLVGRLDALFSRFDAIADRLCLEKIKTIGDAYMVASGLPEAHEDPTGAIARMALSMNDELAAFNRELGEQFALRVGIHCGEVVAGVIGRRKFIYDLWGDTVNVASRMESQGEPGRIQISETMARALEDRFELLERGVVQVKGCGPIRTYWLLGLREGSTSALRV